MKQSHIAIVISTVGLALASSANGQTAGNIIGAPLIAGGGVVSAAAAGHAQIAPTVNKVSPTAEPVTDAVTRGLVDAGGGVSGTGRTVQTNGILVGSSSNGKPLVSVAATAPAHQGTVAAVFNGHR